MEAKTSEARSSSAMVGATPPMENTPTTRRTANWWASSKSRWSIIEVGAMMVQLALIKSSHRQRQEIRLIALAISSRVATRAFHTTIMDREACIRTETSVIWVHLHTPTMANTRRNRTITDLDSNHSAGLTRPSPLQQPSSKIIHAF